MDYCLEGLSKVFIVKYLDEDDIVKFSIDQDIVDFERINSWAPIVDKIINMEIGTISSIENGSKFELINKSKDLVQKFSNYFYNNNIEKLINILKKHNPLGFLHETSLDCLHSIKKSGVIYSRNMMEKMNLLFDDKNKEIEMTHRCLEHTTDKIKSCARFYLKKNAPATYNFPKNSCILVCSYEILREKKYNMYIINKIATSNPFMNNVNNERNLEYILKYDFDDIYSNNGGIDPQIRAQNSAEFLCENSVPLRYINKIIFENINDKLEFKTKFPEWDIETIVDTSFFKRKWR